MHIWTGKRTYWKIWRLSSSVTLSNFCQQKVGWTDHYSSPDVDCIQRRLFVRSCPFSCRPWEFRWWSENNLFLANTVIKADLMNKVHDLLRSDLCVTLRMLTRKANISVGTVTITIWRWTAASSSPSTIRNKITPCCSYLAKFINVDGMVSSHALSRQLECALCKSHCSCLCILRCTPDILITS